MKIIHYVCLIDRNHCNLSATTDRCVSSALYLVTGYCPAPNICLIIDCLGQLTSSKSTHKILEIQVCLIKGSLDN